MSNYIENMLDEIVSEQKGFTTTPNNTQSNKKMNEILHHVEYMTEEDLLHLERKMKLRKDKLKNSKDE